MKCRAAPLTSALLLKPPNLAAALAVLFVFNVIAASPGSVLING
jgi:hypothetical protein